MEQKGDTQGALVEARLIQAKALRRAFLRKITYVALNSAAAYIPLNLIYFISSYTVHKSIVIAREPFIVTAFLVVFILLVGSLIDLVEYALLRIALGLAWRRPPRGALCFGRLIEFGESIVRKRNGLLGKDEEGLFFLRKGRRLRLCAEPYTVSPHGRLGVFTPFILGKVKLRSYLQIDGASERFIVDVISPKDMLERLR
ncbi:MAG TPA: hypothetical protein VMV90_02765 [Rectinemataceae bacterium]|nr:hypothetical protein [Rectinemataceae bacterium]